MNITSIIIMSIIIIILLVVFFGGMINKKKYAGRSMDITKDWYEESQKKYNKDSSQKAYYFAYDKHFLTQGHIMVDQNHKPIYEALILYGNGIKGFEVDFVNHLIDYTHHHKFSAVTTTEVESGGLGATTSSYFKFDGENIWNYIKSLGYEYHLKREGLLAYQIEVNKNGKKVGTIYSSNNGKNYFGCSGNIEAKAGGKGYYVIETADKDLDALFLIAVAFSRTDLSLENMK